jgi:exodeoxyribonuclease VII large subunit
MLEERKRRLAQEGLFDSERKKRLPGFPSRVAVVTSPTGAAIRDILRVLRRRNSGLNLVILPTAVQGEEAAGSIAKQILRANRYALGEVIIVGRGGGSLEDLLPFSEEAVVRAIAESEIPVISAIGHEIDTSLADLAADVPAPTPSAAAEMVSMNREDLLRKVIELKQLMISNISNKTERVHLLLQQFRPEYLERNLQHLIQPVFMRLDDAKEEMINGLTSTITEVKHTIALLTNKLESNSPIEILKKGYALVTKKNTNQRIRSAKETAEGDILNVRFAEDALHAVVEEIEDEKL